MPNENHLSEKTITTVKATVPVLQAGGEALTRHFYKRMFKHNPEVQAFFNPANQIAGTQQRALAAAVCAYAANIDNLGALGDAVELIAHKHVSLRIKPEHYPIVGENLIESIKEVLGDGATDDIITAWTEAYGFLADLLIRREEEIYQTQETTPGGWRDFKRFRVVKKEPESDVITSFYLEPEDGGKPPTFQPGQYITVRVPSPCGHTTMRNYSLSDKPDQSYFRISVKREDGASGDTPAGYVSNMLHQQVKVGDTLELAAPCGEFVLDARDKAQSARPLVLLAAGVGITPILSMLCAALAAAPDRKVAFIHASLHENNQAFKAAVDQLTGAHPHLTTHYRYSKPAPDGVTRATGDHVSEGQIDAELIDKMVGDRDADYYFCGPKPFMVNVHRMLRERGVPAAEIHFEFFGPRQEIEG